MKNFDISRFYDANKFDFVDEFSERDIKEYLLFNISFILDYINRILLQDDEYKYENQIYGIEIVLDTKTKKESPYHVKLKDVLRACKNSSLLDARSFYRDYKDYKKYADDKYLDRNIEESLRAIREKLKNKEDHKILDNLIDEYIASLPNNDNDLIFIIDNYLNREYIAGEYYEKENKIVLYLRVICESRTPSEQLLMTFVHEFFHAYHYFASFNNFASSWKYNHYQYSTVKESLASYIEIEYGKYSKEYELLSGVRTDFLNTQSIKYYPYAGYNLICSNINIFDSRTVFSRIFYVSINDIGTAYNLLIYLLKAQERHDHIYLYNETTEDIEYMRDRQEDIECSRSHKASRVKLEKIRNYIGSYRIHFDTDNTTNRINFIAINKVKKDLSTNDESFSRYLQRLLSEKNVSDPQCYKNANISKGTFNKIINGVVNPKRENVALLALSLRLTSNEYDTLINKAGYARSNDMSNLLNIVGYFIDKHEYDILEIEDAVYQLTGKYLSNISE